MWKKELCQGQVLDSADAGRVDFDLSEKHNTLGQLTQFIHDKAVEKPYLVRILSVTLTSSPVLRLDVPVER